VKDSCPGPHRCCGSTPPAASPRPAPATRPSSPPPASPTRPTTCSSPLVSVGARRRVIRYETSRPRGATHSRRVRVCPHSEMAGFRRKDWSSFGYLGIAFCLFSLFCLISTGDVKDPTYVSSVILAFAICGGGGIPRISWCEASRYRTRRRRGRHAFVRTAWRGLGLVAGYLGIAFCLFSLFCLISTGDVKDPTYVVILAFAICGIVRRGRRQRLGSPARASCRGYFRSAGSSRLASVLRPVRSSADILWARGVTSVRSTTHQVAVGERQLRRLGGAQCRVGLRTFRRGCGRLRRRGGDGEARHRRRGLTIVFPPSDLISVLPGRYRW
jgi:hypothetical protein